MTHDTRYARITARMTDGRTVVLLHGDVRERSSEGTRVAACGCASTDTRWLQLCEPHAATWIELHEAARIAHAATLEST